jgi:ParB-like chromosome segregation protein Spo0J
MTAVIEGARDLTIENLSQIPVDKVPIGSLVVEDSVRGSGENVSHIHALAEVQDNLPPILVQRQTMRVLDGIHRLRAAMLCGAQEIDVRFFDGDEASSFVIAVTANIKHGLPLSLADRKAAAVRVAGYYPEWSDRAIASLTGLSHNTVAAVRECLAGENDSLDARIGRDGRLRPRNSAERREIAEKLIKDNPGASLREIAQRAHISPETARRVRTSLTQADDSVSATAQAPVSSSPIPGVAEKKVLSILWPAHPRDSRKSIRFKASPHLGKASPRILLSARPKLAARSCACSALPG